jgi:hypothetical protein
MGALVLRVGLIERAIGVGELALTRTSCAAHPTPAAHPGCTARHLAGAALAHPIGLGLGQGAVFDRLDNGLGAGIGHQGAELVSGQAFGGCDRGHGFAVGQAGVKIRHADAQFFSIDCNHCIVQQAVLVCGSILVALWMPHKMIQGVFPATMSQEKLPKELI